MDPSSGGARADPPTAPGQVQRRRRRRRQRPGQLSSLVAVAAVTLAGGLLLDPSSSAAGASGSWLLLPGAEAAGTGLPWTPMAWLRLRRRRGETAAGGAGGAGSDHQAQQQPPAPPQQLLLQQLQRLHFALPPFLQAAPTTIPRGLARRAAAAAGALAPVEDALGRWAEEWRDVLGSRGAALWDGAVGVLAAGAARVNGTMGEVDACMERLAASAAAGWAGAQGEWVRLAEEAEARRILWAARVEARRLAAVAAWVHVTTAVDAAVGEARAALAEAAGRVIDLSQVLPEEEALALGLALGGYAGYEYGLLSALESGAEGEDEEAAQKAAAASRRASLRGFRPSRLLFFWRRRPSLGAARSSDAVEAAEAEAEAAESASSPSPSPFQRRFGGQRRRKQGGAVFGGGLGGQQHHLASLNERALRSVLQLAGEGEGDGWERVTSSEGVTVYRKYLDASSAGAAGAAEEVVCGAGGNGNGGGTCVIGEDGVVVEVGSAGPASATEPEGSSSSGSSGSSSRFACVKAVGVVDAPVERVFALFLDSARVREYNDHCREIEDIATLGPDTKVTWSASGRYGPFKARDFCTLVHYRRLRDGALVVVNRAAEHVKAPRSDKYVRSEILLAGNVMRPHPQDPRKTLLVTLTHINPGGSIDSKAGAAMLNMLTATGPVQFLRRVEAAARKGMEEEAAEGKGRRRWGWGNGGNDPSRTRDELGMGEDGEAGGGLGEQWERLITVV